MMRDKILDKMKNPNFDYKNEDKNLFKIPQFPYLFLNVFNLGDETGLYDETSLVEESRELQEGASQLERQILDLNEGQKRVWVVSGESMSEAKAQSLVDLTGDLLVYLDRKAPPGSVAQVQSGKPDASLFNHLSHILTEIDNVMGIHSTSRGDRQTQETFGRSQLLVQSDYGRLDMIVRNVEQVIEEWFNSYLHMLRVYALEAEVLSNGTETVELIADEIPSTTMIMIKKGSTLPTDEVSEAKNAISLAQFGMIDPATLFEELGYTNVDKRTQDLYQWLTATGKIVPQQVQPQQAPQGQPQGQPNAPQGQTGDDQQKVQQLQRVQQLLQSPEFQKLPPEKQKEMLNRAREVVQSIKTIK